MLRRMLLVLWLSAAAAAAAAGSVTVGRERPRCPADVGDRCQQNDYSTDEYFYKINGVTQMISFSSGNYYKTTCGAALDDPALPRFPRPVGFRKVVLRGCAAPANGSYAAALRTLGLDTRALRRLELLALAAAPAAAALAGLGALPELTLASLAPTPLAADALDALGALRRLSLLGVRPTRLPAGLASVVLRGAGLARLPPAPLLTQAEVADDALRDASALGGMSRLAVLSLDAPLDAPPPLPESLEVVMVSRLAAASLEAWAGCGRLRDLSLRYGRLARLAGGWLRGCGALRRLALDVQPRLRRVPPDLLRGAPALTALRITSTQLDALPPGLFDYTKDLQDINLSRNNLKTLPSDVFAPVAGSLRALELSVNALGAAAVAALAELAALEALALGRNPLGDLCAAHAWAASPLGQLRALGRLSLSGAGLSRLCTDWLRDMPRLRLLDLTANNLTALQLSDVLSLRRSQPSTIDLSHNPLVSLLGSRDDYERAERLIDIEQVSAVLMTSRLRCDCDTYWWWRALRLRLPVALDARCDHLDDHLADDHDHRLAQDLRDMTADDLTCVVEAPVCPAGCRCRAVPPRPELVVRCVSEPAALPALPIRRLTLAAPRLPRLPLPATLRWVDLSDNNISRDDPAAAERLFAHGRRVSLAGNPLACDCGAGSLLDVLRAHRAQLAAPAPVCDDGRALADALAQPPCDARARPALGAALGVACAALLACAAAVLRAHAALRLRVKAALARRGCWRRRWRAEDAARPYDAFVSHAPEDERWVLQTLAPRLEARGLRLCLRARDWPPGAWIPTQIEASVRASRLVLVVVSRHWAAAAWARAELRAAHAHALAEPGPAARPRLLLLRLDRTPLPSDVTAPAAAAATAARLRWGERAFWDKLLYALPAPAPAAAPTPAPAAA